jgi:hemoglobin-like flavoprotein
MPKLEELGSSHLKDHGVKKEHYVFAGQALLYLFEQVLGDDFTPEVKTAWLQVWGIMEACMTKCYDEKQ